MIRVEDLKTPTISELETLDRNLSFVPTTNTSPKVLSSSQIADYNSLGYLMPLDGLSEREIRDLREFFDRILDEALARGETSYSISTAHLRFGTIYDLMFHPKIVDAVSDLLGPDLVAWGAHFFCKMPNDGKRVPWHQDCTYWPLTPARTVTVWLAIDDASPENANMQFIPRSHLDGVIGYEESRSTDDVLNIAIEDVSGFADGPVDDALKAGQFSMHSDLLLHGSEANDSEKRRCGLTMRYAAAEVTAHLGWDAKGVVVRGEDKAKNWRNLPRPD
ncbi:MAG: phytanoyl-CoA dioxygenase family protein [Verrucomicrobiota bacterium]